MKVFWLERTFMYHFFNLVMCVKPTPPTFEIAQLSAYMASKSYEK